MPMMAIDLLGAVAILVIAAFVARLASIARNRKQLRAAITDAQARANAAPLSTAILASQRRPGARV
jgi:CHASE3 domain sensor protein